MTILSHVLVTALGVNILNLAGNDVLYAYTFGVLPDLDHIVKIPNYLKDNGFKFVRKYPWRTFLQEPVMLLPIAVFSLVVASFVPFLFFGIHLLLDYLISYEKKPLSPFFGYSTKGIFKNTKDIYKEGFILLTVVVCLILLS